MAAFQSGQPPTGEVVRANLLNEIATLEVLDL
jgi:hypothetical protein